MEKINISDIENSGVINFDEMYKSTFVDVNKDLKRPPIALSIGEVSYNQKIYDCEFGTFGNFSCISGASKAKKTFLKSLILASFIGGEADRYGNRLKTHRKRDMYVLDFDTEQSEWHSQRVFKRVCKIVGGNYEFYKPFYLRRYDYKERIQFIEYMIMESEFKNNIAWVNIDGFADLVKDVNDLVSCNDLVQKLLKWTDVSQCHLSGVLHQNYNSDKPTGHLGSAILKKAETVCSLKVDENDKNITNVTFPYTRGFKIDDFSFILNDIGLPEIVEDQTFL